MRSRRCSATISAAIRERTDGPWKPRFRGAWSRRSAALHGAGYATDPARARRLRGLLGLTRLARLCSSSDMTSRRSSLHLLPVLLTFAAGCIRKPEPPPPPPPAQAAAGIYYEEDLQPAPTI